VANQPFVCAATRTEALAQFYASSSKAEGGAFDIRDNNAYPVRTGPDMIRRFTPTPVVGDLHAAGQAIRLETNSPTILRRVTEGLSHYERTGGSQVPFLWRLISDDDVGHQPPWREPMSLTVDGLCLLSIGERSFVAVDAEAHCAVGFLAEALVDDSTAFERLVLARLCSMTAAAPSGTRHAASSRVQQGIRPG